MSKKFFNSRQLLVIMSIFLLSGITATAISKSNPSNGNDIKPIVIKMATLAPKDSPWHEILKDMAAEWREASGGQVTLRIYPGGVAGDEADMVRKIRIGQLHAAAITNAGLSRIAPETTVLTIPMAVDSWQGLDRVRKTMAPRLESHFEKKGFVVLNWGDAGWVRFFVPGSSPTIGAVQKTKLFVWSGDDRTVEIWKSAGFRVVPLAATDILPGLQTGMITSFNTTPIIALTSQWFPFTESMIDLPWAPLIGATVISQKAWQEVPESMRATLKDIAENTGQRLKLEIRRMEEQAIAEMQKRGLNVIKPTPEQIAEWQKVMQSVYPKIRGQLVPADWFDDALTAAASKETVANGR